MIKPLEESTVMNVSHSFPSGALKPLQRVEMAVNMLIEEHNTLLQAMVDFNVMGTDAWQNIMLDEKDPNEPHHHPQEG